MYFQKIIYQPFTVVPYAVMSIVNLIANMLVPHYPTLYMVRTPTMDQAEEAGGQFEGVVTVQAHT